MHERMEWLRSIEDTAYFPCKKTISETVHFKGLIQQKKMFVWASSKNLRPYRPRTVAVSLQSFLHAPSRVDACTSTCTHVDNLEPYKLLTTLCSVSACSIEGLAWLHLLPGLLATTVVERRFAAR